MALHNEIGKQGEIEALDYLQASSYTILEKNYRFSRSEIDIIALKDETLVFLEVKTRTSVQFGHPEEFLSAKQEKRIAHAALHYIEKNEIENEIRFDVIAILKGKRLEHIEDAFFLID